jgi:hypothetical protein
MTNSFVKEIEVSGNTRTFNFLGVYTTKGTRYYISVIDANSKPYLFHMDYQNNRWVIIDAPKVSKWIHDLGNELEKAIKENGE